MREDALNTANQKHEAVNELEKLKMELKHKDDLLAQA